MRFDQELNMAEKARAEGNEGKARVCARRAAGIIVEQYLIRRSTPVTRSNAYTLLQTLIQINDLPDVTKEMARHFLLRITPDHTLPVEADLIAEARWLAYELLGNEM